MSHRHPDPSLRHAARALILSGFLAAVPACGPDNAEPAAGGRMPGSLTAGLADVPQASVIGLERITQAWSQEYAAGWSPEGDRLLYSTDEHGHAEVYAREADPAIRSAPVRITRSEGWDNLAGAWSPDGSRIAFTSYRDRNAELYVQDLWTEEELRLTNDPAEDWGPTWHPDGTSILISSNRAGNWDLWSVPLDGAEALRVTHDAAQDRGGRYSPDGAWIVFSSDRSGQPDLYLMRTDTAEVRRLTTDPAEDTDPSWSADGEWIAFRSTRDGGTANIFIIRPDGSDLMRVTRSAGQDNFPAWSPDGRRILFQSTRDLNAELYVATLTGLEPAPVPVDEPGATDTAGEPLAAGLPAHANRTGRAQLRELSGRLDAGGRLFSGELLEPELREESGCRRGEQKQLKHSSSLRPLEDRVHEADPQSRPSGRFRHGHGADQRCCAVALHPRHGGQNRFAPLGV